VGAVVSIVIAVWVLNVTLRAERKQFRKQLESERNLGIEQRRIEAFGDFVAEMNEYLEFPTDPDELRTIRRATDAALQRWMLYVQEEDDAVRTGVSERRSAIVARVSEVAERHRATKQCLTARLRRRTRERERTTDAGVRSALSDLAHWGRIWHSREGGRSDAARELAQLTGLPERSPADLA
jgi:hypothetical protein